MKTHITLLSLALFSLSASAADITGTWKTEFDTQRGLQIGAIVGDIFAATDRAFVRTQLHRAALGEVGHPGAETADLPGKLTVDDQ